MDPLVDEYMDPNSKLVGTQLKSMPAALQKMKEFYSQNLKVLSVFLVINVVLRVRSLIQS